ncbi:MAG: hypothetical protein AAGE18_06100 [Pseudomonadota bacterium]
MRDDPNLPTYAVAELQSLLAKTVVELGIGGFVPAQEIVRVFNPMSARDFAQIAYAADFMASHLHEPHDSKGAEAMVEVIGENQFYLKPRFNQLEDRFRTWFEGHEVVRF